MNYNKTIDYNTCLNTYIMNKIKLNNFHLKLAYKKLNVYRPHLKRKYLTTFKIT